jgi:proton-translocating NADH-quinone oxidoreductase chain N
MTATTALYLLLGILPLACPIIYLVGRLGVRTGGTAAAARWLAIATVLAAWVPFVFLAQTVQTQGKLLATIGAVSLAVDGISLLLAATVLTLGALVLIFSIPYMRGDDGEEKYYALILAMMGTMIGLGCSNDLFNIWVWFEAMAISTYLLVAFYREEPASLEAGVKYLVQSAVGSVLVLLGIALVFAHAKSLRLDVISQVEFGGLALGAGALFVVGFGVKTALVPLHTWLPDAHSQAPSGISAMLSGIVIEVGLVAMLRTLGCLPGSHAAWGAVLLFFGGLNIVVGNLMALRQTQVKRMLAYSSLAHMGYMLVGFGVAAGFGLSDAAAGGFFHLFNHALMKGLAFLSAGLLLYALHIAKGEHTPLLVSDLDGAAQRYPLTAFALSIAVLALGGLPPLAGFMSKWQIFAASAETRNLPVILLVVFAALNSVLSLAYYAPLVNRLYRRQPSEVVLAGKPASRLMSFPLVALTVFVVVLGFWPALLNGLTSPAAISLILMFGGN